MGKKKKNISSVVCCSYEKQKLAEWVTLQEQRKKLFSHYPPERDEDFHSKLIDPRRISFGTD